MMRKAEGFSLMWPIMKKSPARAANTTRSTPTAQKPNKPIDVALTAKLQAWVLKTAKSQNVPSYQILPKATVEAIAAEHPTSFTELEAVKGMGPVKVQRYGREILDMIGAAP
jgi:Superfamily II DNA helicase